MFSSVTQLLRDCGQVTNRYENISLSVKSTGLGLGASELPSRANSSRMLGSYTLDTP